MCPWSSKFSEFVARYHYLGYKTLVGAQMRYAVHDRNGRPVAMLGFSTAAWKLAPRDSFIGWTPQLREKNLPLVVDSPRFLILPWSKIPNLGSHILAIVRRRLPGDWAECYNTTPVLIETFVQTPRYTGAVYRASGSAPSEKIGNEPSTAKVSPPSRPGRDGHIVGRIVHNGWNLPKARLVTRLGMWYSCRHDDSRRGCSSEAFVGREASWSMVSSP